jgi:hypothetical protein
MRPPVSVVGSDLQRDLDANVSDVGDDDGLDANDMFAIWIALGPGPPAPMVGMVWSGVSLVREMREW